MRYFRPENLNNILWPPTSPPDLPWHKRTAWCWLCGGHNSLTKIRSSKMKFSTLVWGERLRDAWIYFGGQGSSITQIQTDRCHIWWIFCHVLISRIRTSLHVYGKNFSIMLGPFSKGLLKWGKDECPLLSQGHLPGEAEANSALSCDVVVPMLLFS